MLCFCNRIFFKSAHMRFSEREFNKKTLKLFDIINFKKLENYTMGCRNSIINIDSEHYLFFI